MRNPPAFQEYASDLMANEKYRLMTAGERGLFHSMRLACWANYTTPAAPAGIARILGLSESEVRECLTHAVLSFFDTSPIDDDRLICPELDAYREHLLLTREKKSAGGKKGANARWNKKIRSHGKANGNAIVLPMAQSEKSTTQFSRKGSGRGEPLPYNPDDAVEREEYVAAFEGAR